MDDKKKKNSTSQGKWLAAMLLGVIDMLLVVLLVLVSVLDVQPAKEGKVTIEKSFETNASNYGQVNKSEEYPIDDFTAYENTSVDQQVTQTEEGPYSGFVFPYSDSMLLTDSDISIAVQDPATCRQAINEIYARHGYAFTKQENIDFFNRFEWYRNMNKETDMAKVSSHFSTIEKANVEKLQAYENSRGWN